MAWYILLYLSEPCGSKLLGKKRRPYDDDMYIPDGFHFGQECISLEKIIGSPYSIVERTWSGSALDELLAQINQLKAELENMVIQQILEKIKHPSVKEWMEPMIEEELDKFQPLLKVRQFLSLAIRAKNENGTIIVCGD